MSVNSENIAPSTKKAFITGGTGGLGAATVRYLTQHGWHVFAADFDRSALESLDGVPGVTPVFVDVTDTESVEAAKEKVLEQTDQLQAIVNFAGILAVGSMVEIPEETLQRVLDVNVMGTYRVNRAFYPLVKAGKGRIVNISSETGWQSGAPFNGAYAMSKHAIECYSDSLRREMAFFDIPVIKVQPGPFRTEMVGSIESNFKKAVDGSKEFKGILNRTRKLAEKESAKSHDPTILAGVIYQALTVAKPKIAYSVKPDPMRTLLEYFPTTWADAMFKKVMAE